MSPNPKFPADLAPFTEKILMENFIFGAVKAKTFRSTEHPFPMLRNAMTNALFTLKLLLFFGVVLKCCRKILSTYVSFSQKKRERENFVLKPHFSSNIVWKMAFWKSSNHI